MKVDFSAKLLDLEKKEIKEGDKVMTLSSVSCTALLATYPDEQNLEATTKVKRFRLAEKAINGGVQELAVEDVVELKKLIGKAYSPLVVGRVYDIIDPPPPETNSAES